MGLLNKLGQYGANYHLKKKEKAGDDIRNKKFSALDEVSNIINEILYV